MKKEANDPNGERRRAMRHLFQLCAAPLLLALVGAGCKPEAKAPAALNPVGTYTLASVDGKQVPCVVKHEAVALTVKSGTFIINADGTCSSMMVFTPPSGGDASREVKATYTREGSKLTLKWEGAGITTGTVEGDKFTMENEGMAFVYRK